jgi:hypothetical protein
MITVRPAGERGHSDLGWLDSRHTFSFAAYNDPRHVQFRDLRVINEDRVRPGKGFATHGHRDMEILTFVLEGALAHQDSMENGSVMHPGEVQRMSAGTGVTHSEYNHSQIEDVHFLQVWIFPETEGLTPEYEQKSFADEEKKGRLRLVASRDGRDGSVTLHQDAGVYWSILGPGQAVTHPLRPGRHAWVHLIRGAARVNNLILETGDGAAVSEEKILAFTASKPSEILLFDMK